MGKDFRELAKLYRPRKREIKYKDVIEKGIIYAL